eukprot:c21242_g1_i1.p1 GENE.c21242_g1_i1~~c21242_g1_i1.p1  ORF type:complete len:357 (-),score=82.07 c21242_g1_i1:170-1240(-)
MKNLSLVTDVLFTTLVTLLMFSMKMPGRHTKGVKHLMYNTAFWVYVMYWVKTVGTMFRIPVNYDHLMVRAAVMLWFNWTGSVIVTLSAVGPCQLFFHYKKNGSFVTMPQEGRFWGSAFVMTVHCSAFLVTCVLGATKAVSLDRLLLAWRIFFFINSFVELFFLIVCLYLIRSIAVQKQKFAGLKNHLMITLYMRVGLCTTIFLKIMGLLPKDMVVTIHLFIIFTSMLLYHLRTVSKAESTQHCMRLFKSIFSFGQTLTIDDDATELQRGARREGGSIPDSDAKPSPSSQHAKRSPSSQHAIVTFGLQPHCISSTSPMTTHTLNTPSCEPSTSPRTTADPHEPENHRDDMEPQTNPV